MGTQQELDAKIAVAEEKRVAYEFMASHGIVQSPRIAEAFGGYLKKYNLGFTRSNLEQAFVVLKAQGFRFSEGSGAQAPQTSQDELPWVPDYMLAVNPLKTKKDIDALSREDYRKFYNGPDQAAFRKRVEFVANLKRG